MTIHQAEYAYTDPASSIFIDIPNVASPGTGRRKRLVWSALAKTMLDNGDLQETKLGHIAAYSQYRQEALQVARIFGTIFRTRYSTFVQAVTRVDKDIDSLIMNDIWQSVVTHQQSTIARLGSLQFPLQVRHIIASGDAGYLRAYEGLRSVYKESLECELIVYSWRGSLSHEYARAANQIHYLDDIPGFVQYVDLIT